VTDGLAVFEEGTLTGKTFLLAIPGVALRYAL
jgi:hypothetical protein